MIIILKSMFAFGISILISFLGYKRKSLSLSGAILSVIVGFVHALSSFTILTSLFVFFISCSYITKLGKSKKAKFENDFKEGGQRDWVQVFSNGLPSLLACVVYLVEVGVKVRDSPIDFHLSPVSSMATVAAVSGLAAACGDTFASEVGSAFSRGDPWIIVPPPIRRVPRGTNGGVSVLGTLASLGGGLLIGLSAFGASHFSIGTPVNSAAQGDLQQWPIVVLAVLAGCLGSVIDSMLGATAQYSGVNVKSGRISHRAGPNIRHVSGIDLLDNHNVNLISCLITAVTLGYGSFFLWPHFLWLRSG